MATALQPVLELAKKHGEKCQGHLPTKLWSLGLKLKLNYQKPLVLLGTLSLHPIIRMPKGEWAVVEKRPGKSMDMASLYLLLSPFYPSKIPILLING